MSNKYLELANAPAEVVAAISNPQGSSPNEGVLDVLGNAAQGAWEGVKNIPSMVAGIPGALSSANDAIEAQAGTNMLEGKTDLGFPGLRAAGDLYVNRASNQSVPQTLADMATIPGLAIGGLTGGASVVAPRVLANTYDRMGEGATAGELAHGAAFDTTSAGALPGLMKLGSEVKAGMKYLFGSEVEKAPRGSRIRSNMIFKRQRLNSKADEIVTTGNEADKYFRDAGVIKGVDPAQWVVNYRQALDGFGSRINGILQDPLGKNGESIGSQTAQIPSRVIAGGGGRRVVLPEVEQVIKDLGIDKNPTALKEVNDFIQDNAQPLVEQPLTVSDLLNQKRLFSMDNQELWRSRRLTGAPISQLPDSLDRIEQAFYSDMKSFLEDNVGRAASDLAKAGGKKDALMSAARDFEPVNKQWSEFLRSKRDWLEFGVDLTRTPLQNALNYGTVKSGMIPGLATSAATGSPMTGLATGMGVASKRGLILAAGGADLAGQLGDVMSPVTGAVSSGANLSGAILGNPAAMGAAQGFMQQPITPPQLMPRDGKAVIANPGAVLPFLPPAEQQFLFQAIKGGEDAVNTFMSQQLQVNPALAQAFVPSQVSPTEFGGRFDDPMTTYSIYQDVTSKMLREEIDPRRAYRAQKDAIQGKVPSMMQ